MRCSFTTSRGLRRGWYLWKRQTQPEMENHILFKPICPPWFSSGASRADDRLHRDQRARNPCIRRRRPDGHQPGTRRLHSESQAAGSPNELGWRFLDAHWDNLSRNTRRSTQPRKRMPATTGGDGQGEPAGESSTRIVFRRPSEFPARRRVRRAAGLMATQARNQAL